MSLAGDLAEEVVEALAGAGDALHEEEARAVGRDPLRERARERDGGALLRQARELVRDSRAERGVARAGEREELNEKEGDEGGSRRERPAQKEEVRREFLRR